MPRTYIQLDAAPGISVQLKTRLMFSIVAWGSTTRRIFERAARDFDRAYEVDPSLYAQIGKALSESTAHRGANGLEIQQGLEGKIEHRGVGDPEATYKIAQAYSMLGGKLSVLRALRSSVEGGFFSYLNQASDLLLDTLRKPAMPRFAWRRLNTKAGRSAIASPMEKSKPL